MTCGDGLPSCGGRERAGAPDQRSGRASRGDSSCVRMLSLCSSIAASLLKLELLND